MTEHSSKTQGRAAEGPEFQVPALHSPNNDYLGIHHSPSANSARRSPAVWLATGFGFGFSPLMPGTVGMLWGLPLVWGLAELSATWRWCVIALLIAAGIPLCTRAARQLSGGKDPGSIVWDEIASLPLVFVGNDPQHVGWLLTGFVLHRVFDITKPPPVRQAEHLPEGLGIMADDVVAAGYAWLALRLLRYLVG